MERDADGCCNAGCTAWQGGGGGTTAGCAVLPQRRRGRHPGGGYQWHCQAGGHAYRTGSIDTSIAGCDAREFSTGGQRGNPVEFASADTIGDRHTITTAHSHGFTAACSGDRATAGRDCPTAHRNRSTADGSGPAADRNRPTSYSHDTVSHGGNGAAAHIRRRFRGTTTGDDTGPGCNALGYCVAARSRSCFQHTSSINPGHGGRRLGDARGCARAPA